MVDNKPAARQGWVIPILVSLAIILPQLIAIIPGASSVARTSSTEWLINGTIQSLSHVMLLAVIIGVSGRSREFGVYKPRPRDIPASALIFGGMLLIGRIIALIATNSGLLPDRSRFLGGNLSLAATLALAAGFSLASAYREELFYRAYLLGSFRQHSTPTAAALVVSVTLFTWGHTYQGPVGMVSAALIGLFLAFAWTRGTSLHALAWGHAIYNWGILVFS